MSNQQAIQDIINQFTKGKGEMLEALGNAQTIIGGKLESKKEELAARLGTGKTVTILPYAGTAGKGLVTNEYDRSLFHWNGVAVEDGKERREYLIDLFCNEVDRKHCNFHSQIGRFQFAALQPVTLGKNGKSPHTKAGGKFQFNEERLKDYEQSLTDYGFFEKNTELKCFEPGKLVKDFLDFVEEKER